jgi:hypothetical protein
VWRERVILRAINRGLASQLFSPSPHPLPCQTLGGTHVTRIALRPSVLLNKGLQTLTDRIYRSYKQHASVALLRLYNLVKYYDDTETKTVSTAQVSLRYFVVLSVTMWEFRGYTSQHSTIISFVISWRSYQLKHMVDNLNSWHNNINLFSLLIYTFIYSLFNDAVSRSDYIPSKIDQQTVNWK